MDFQAKAIAGLQDINTFDVKFRRSINLCDVVGSHTSVGSAVFQRNFLDYQSAK